MGSSAAEHDAPEPEPDVTPGLEPDDAPEPEPEPEPEPIRPDGAEPVQPEPLTEAKAEAILSALERENVRHAKEVQKRAGVMFDDLVPCPCCDNVAGFMLPHLPEPLASERIQRVFAGLGLDTGEQYAEAEDKQTCPKCHGWGQTRTGSRVTAQMALPCAACNGQGWTHRAAQMAPQLVQAFAPTPNLVAPPNGGGNGNVTDPWGRPLGHPHYGIAPEMVGV